MPSLLNSQGVVIDSARRHHGKDIARRHLFRACNPAQEEDKCRTPGDALVSFDPWVAADLALTICHDLRSPEIDRTLLPSARARMFLPFLSAWPFPRVEHQRVWPPRARSKIRAMSFPRMTRGAGKDDGVPFCGSSAVIGSLWRWWQRRRSIARS